MTSLDRRNDVSHEEAAAPGEVRRWRAFSLLAVAFFMTVVDLTIVNVALPTIGRKLPFPQSDLPWVGTAYALTFRGVPPPGGPAPDPPRAITVTGALVVLVYAISQASTVGWTAIRTLALLAAAAALLAGFLVVETRAEAPLLPLRLFRLKTLAGSNAVGFLLGASFFSFFFTGTLYMQQVLGYSALKTGVAWLATSVTVLALAGPAQILVTRLSAKLVMAAGMALIGAGILWATQVPAHGHFWANLAGPLFLAGGAAFAFIPVSIGALAGVTEHDAGIASGLINTSQQIGGAIGVAVASTVAAAHSRLLLSQGHAAAAALTGGFQWAVWGTGLTPLAAGPVTFLLIRRTELARAVAAALQREAPVPAPSDLPACAGPATGPGRHTRGPPVL